MFWGDLEGAPPPHSSNIQNPALLGLRGIGIGLKIYLIKQNFQMNNYLNF